MKSFLVAFVALLGVAIALQCTIPTFDCAGPAVPSYYNRSNGAKDLFTPELCVDPTWEAADADIDHDHILLYIRYQRYHVVQNITGQTRDLPLYLKNGECSKEEHKWSFDIGYDNDYFYLRAKIAFSALKATGCVFTDSHNIYCVWWMSAIEHFQLGGVQFTQNITVRWPLYIHLPNRLAPATANIEVWPQASYQAAILVFEEYAPPSYVVRVVFLVMVHKPYMATGAYVVPPAGVTGWATPALPSGDVAVDASDCVHYNTEYCYQQIEIEMVPLDPCGSQEWPLSRDTYNGTYTLYGTTACETGDDAEVCHLPAHHSWFDWSFSFEFDTNNFCPTYLEYVATDKLQGVFQTYNSSEFTDLTSLFIADNVVYGKITVEKLDPDFPFLVKKIHTTRLTVGVIIPGMTEFTYYELAPNFEILLNQTLVQFSGIYEVETATEVYNWFSIVMSSEEDQFTLGINPPTTRQFVFNATITVEYDWLSSTKHAQLQDASTLQALHVILGVPDAPYGEAGPIPTATTPAVASSNVALIATVAVGSVVVAAAAAIGVIVLRRRRAHYESQKDSA